MINQIKEALEKATPGPWTHSRWAYGYVVTDYPLHNTVASVVEYNEDGAVHKEFDNWEANRTLIANTPTYLRYLLDELEKAQKDVEVHKYAHRICVNDLIDTSDELDMLKEMNKKLITEHTAMKKTMESAYNHMHREDFQTAYESIYKVLSTLTCTP